MSTGVSLVSLVCDVARHDLCTGYRAVTGDNLCLPCYCTCHFSGRGVEWQCAHGKDIGNHEDGRAHAPTDRQRRAIRDYHRTHTLNRRKDLPKL